MQREKTHPHRHHRQVLGRSSRRFRAYPSLECGGLASLPPLRGRLQPLHLVPFPERCRLLHQRARVSPVRCHAGRPRADRGDLPAARQGSVGENQEARGRVSPLTQGIHSGGRSNARRCRQPDCTASGEGQMEGRFYTVRRATGVPFDCCTGSDDEPRAVDSRREDRGLAGALAAA